MEARFQGEGVVPLPIWYTILAYHIGMPIWYGIPQYDIPLESGIPLSSGIPLERQLNALQFAADSFYIMKLCSRLFVLYCRSRPKDDTSRQCILIPILRKLGVDGSLESPCRVLVKRN